MQRRGLRIGWLALVTLGAAALAGCGEETVQPPVIHDLSDPWQVAPFQLADPVYVAVEAACRESGMAQGGTLAVIDARGADTAIVVLVAPNARGECVVTREAGSYAVPSSGEMSGEGAVETIGAREIANANVSTGEQLRGPLGPAASTYVIGQAGVDVGTIDVVLGSGQRVRASFWGRGWFAAWWPGEETTVRFEAIDTNGVLITPP